MHHLYISVSISLTPFPLMDIGGGLRTARERCMHHLYFCLDLSRVNLTRAMYASSTYIFLYIFHPLPPDGYRRRSAHCTRAARCIIYIYIYIYLYLYLYLERCMHHLYISVSISLTPLPLMDIGGGLRTARERRAALSIYISIYICICIYI